MEKSIRIFDKTLDNITPTYWSVLEDAYINRKIDEDFEDIFSISFISGMNSDGTDRMIVEMA